MNRTALGVAVGGIVLMCVWFFVRRARMRRPASSVVIARLTGASKTFTQTRFSAEADGSMYHPLEDLVHHLISLPPKERKSECQAIFATAEELMTSNSDASRETVVNGLFEAAQNITSHIDVPVKRDEFTPHLRPVSKREWDGLDKLWQDAGAAAESRGEKPAMNDATYRKIENPELRRAVRGMFRRQSSGRYIGIADVVRYETRN